MTEELPIMLCTVCGLQVKQCDEPSCPIKFYHATGETHFCDIAEDVEAGREPRPQINRNRKAKYDLSKLPILKPFFWQRREK